MRSAAVIGSGPNGLAGAVALAAAGLDVTVYEAHETLGGGTRTAELTLPGFRHDVCSAIHPLARASPVFRHLDIPWVEPPAACAHPFDDGTAVTLEREIDATAAQLAGDGDAYRRLALPVTRAAAAFAAGGWPLQALREVGTVLRSTRAVAEAAFASEPARGFFAGHAAHSMLRLEQRPSAGFALALTGFGHAVGWPFPRGGSIALADALAARVRALGGTIRTGSPVDALPRADIVLADVSPRELLRIARLPQRYAAALRRYRYGLGTFKVDWALAGPIPWRAGVCRRAATVHLGGTFEEISTSERGAWDGRGGREQPFVLLAQQSLFDDTRAPTGRQTAWAYCHVPHGANDDMTDAIEAQVERFAPGFRDLILARATRGSAQFEADNRNCVGGDINGGVMDVRQLLFRPVAKLVPWRTPIRGLYLCSAATPPGGGVHGLCGLAAAKIALRDLGE